VPACIAATSFDVDHYLNLCIPEELDKTIRRAGPDLAGGMPGAPGGRPGPSGVFGTIRLAIPENHT